MGADLVTTAVTDINSLTFTNKDFVLTPTNLVSGTLLDVRVPIVVNDAGTGTVVEAAIASIEAVMSIRG